jgi:hypothetical protein
VFIEGIVGLCSCGDTVHVEDVVYVAATQDGAWYALNHGCAVIVSADTHRAAARWLRAKADNDLAEPTDAELTLVDFELELEHVETLADVEPLWVK